MRRRQWRSGITGWMLGLLVACGGDESEEPEVVVADTAPLIGVSLGPRIDGLEALFRAEARARDLRLHVEQAYGKADAQTNQLRKLLDENLVGVVVLPLGPSTVQFARMQADPSNVPTVMLGLGQHGGGIRVGVDSESWAKKLGQRVCQKILDRGTRVPVILLVEDRYWWGETKRFSDEVLQGMETLAPSLEVLARLRLVGDPGRDQGSVRAALESRKDIDLVIASDTHGTRVMSRVDPAPDADTGPFVIGMSDEERVLETAESRYPRYLVLGYERSALVAKSLDIAAELGAGDVAPERYTIPLQLAGEDESP